MPSTRSIAAKIRKEGQPLILKRVNISDLDVVGVVQGYEAHELEDDIFQGDRRVIISNEEIDDAGWPGPPRRGDQIMIDDKTAAVQSVETQRLRGQIAKHTIQVRGG